MADKANAEQGFDDITLWFFFQHFLSLKDLFKEEDNMITGETAGITVLSSNEPLAVVDVTSAKGFFANSPCIASLVPPCCNGQWRVCHTVLSEAGDDSTCDFLFKDFNIGNEVTPVDVEGGVEAVLMEMLEKLEVMIPFYRS